MNKFKKIGLTALAGSLVASSAFAGTMAVTGSAGINFFGEEKQDTGNGFSMTDEITFAGSGEMDNGIMMSVSMQLDGSESTAMDNRSITLEFPDAGKLVFSGHGGDSVLSAMDDKMPTAYEESWDVVTGADTATKVGGPSSNNMFHYSNGELMDNLTVMASYTPSGSTEAEGSVDYGLTYATDGGLTVGLGMGEDKAVTGSNADIENAYVTYAMEGGITLGVQTASHGGQGADEDRDFTAYGISYAVDENLSISYGSSQVDFEDSTLENQEASAVGFSYTMGSMTLAGSHNTVDNVAGSSADDNQGYEVDLSFAF